ncbi:hypothetical protein BS78_07G135500 [Paspalum vaginatum]|nr:hypothetical protein BS78_07G135500 [Paspalum vaginatum]
MDEEQTTPHQNQSEQECIEAIGTSTRKRGRQAKNKLPETVYVVNEVGVARQPLQPYLVRAKFSNTVGVVARSWMEPTWPDWRKVPDERKNFLWGEVKKVFHFPRGSEERAKKYALKQLGESYRRWRTYLNDKYVKNNLTPFAEFGRITQAQWDEFVRQKTTEEAIELSKANTALAKRDTHKSHLGPGGYAAKVDKWNKEREDAIAKGLPDPYKGVKVAMGEKDFPKPETKEVVSRITSLAEEHKARKFVLDREKDFLIVAIGTKEHGGRCRGISSKLNWKEGFTEDRYKYKKHDHNKKEMRETAEQVFKKRFFTFVKNTPSLAIPGLASSLDLDSSPGLASSPDIGSTPCLVLPLIPSNDQRAVDSVTYLTPCELHIPLGIHGRTEEVARALAIPGSGLFHGTSIPPDYARVQVLSVEPKHEGERLDIPTPEGIHFLGQSVNQFILWHKKYIMNLAPQEQLQLEQGHVVLEHGPIGDAMEEEHVVPERDHADSDPPIHEFVPTPPDLTEKPATSLEVVEKLATPSEVIEKPAPS